MKRSDASPWIKLDSSGDRDMAERLANIHQRYYPKAAIEVREE
jgi:hypothetical protein